MLQRLHLRLLEGLQSLNLFQELPLFFGNLMSKLTLKTDLRAGHLPVAQSRPARVATLVGEEAGAV